MKLCSLCLSVDQVRETVQILPAFYPSPESLLHGSLRRSLSLSQSPSLHLPPCPFSLLLGKINRSALKFSVLSVKMAKRLTKRRQNCRVLMKQRLSLPPLLLLLLAPPTDNEMSAANAATRPPTHRSGRGRGSLSTVQRGTAAMTATIATHNGSWQARTSYSQAEYLRQKTLRGD